MREVRIYKVETDDTTAAVRLQDVRRVALVSSADPEIHVAFRSTALGEGKVNLLFGSRGNLVGVEQSTNAALAEATSTLAGALSGARQEFLASLQGVQSAQSTVATIQDNARNARILELQDRKAIIDAQVAYEGADASRDLLAEKQRIDAQVALLLAQQSLVTATSNAAGSADLATMRAELERIKVELELIQRRLELEKAQQARP
jgi:hypothetical protein